MKNWNNARHNPVFKTGAFLLALVLLSACTWLSFITLMRWDDIWLSGGYYRSTTARQDTLADLSYLQDMVRLQQRKEWMGSLTYYEQEQLKNLEARFASGKTNFRYEVHDQAGELLHDNLDGSLLEQVTASQYLTTFEMTLGNRYYNEDYSVYKEDSDRYIKMVYNGESFVPCDPADTVGKYNQYGWVSYEGSEWDSYDSSFDTRIRTREVVLEYGVASPMTVQDDYTASMQSYEKMQVALPTIALIALITLLCSLTLIIFLCSAAGRQADGSLATGWQERIPFDVYLLLDTLMVSLLLVGGDAITYSSGLELTRPVIMGLGVFTLAFVSLALGLMLTIAVRAKTRTHNSIIGRSCRAVLRFFGGAFRNLPITRRMVLFFLLYLLGTFFTTLTLILIPVYQGFVLWLLCRWLRQWRSIRKSTEQLLGGNPDVKIDTTGMFRDLREHAEQLNDLGGAIGSAVDEQLKSERFKAELITNVSHDLKTPLTSIINYVGLLKKVPLDNPQAEEYIDVLDRKSQRLKKLTEDLVDASKASTGSLTVNLERLGMGQLLCQALGEYEEKFAAQELEVIFTPPADELYVWADGRHLWRVVDNLFANCAKYAMSRTRIYLELRRWDGSIFFSVKNISRQALNVPPEQLMERFVRGEESRSTEGSGLGLSIARSLTELQKGTFRLDIDGDLFKATISFPEAYALPESLPVDPSSPEEEAV